MSIQLAANLVVAERFRLNQLLGRGGMGSVWHASHLGLDIPCAVKFIEGEYAQLPEAQQRFEREAKAAAQLRSPHVVQILDHGVWQGTPYIAMELLDGEDLGKRLTRVGRLPSNELNTVITQVCRALTKAHGLNVVHRDLKPDNIFLVKDDDREIAKVLDFGIAKANTNALEGSNTKTGAMLGTPYYMSPEQAQGTKSVDYRSDLWSLAVIVFQAVTGRLPFESEALGDLLVKIIVNPIPVPSQVAADVPVAFDRWWAKAAARDPAQRFQSAKELGDSLGLVWGISQMTDVMDRNQIRQMMGGVAAGSPVPQGTAPLLTPPGYGQQNYGSTPQPQLQNTPQPGVMMSTTPMPAQGHGGATPGYGQPSATTGAPIARTYNGDMVAGVPKKGSGMLIALVAVGVLVLAGGGVGIAVAMKGGKAADPSAAAAGKVDPAAATSATSTPTAPLTTTETTPSASTASPPPPPPSASIAVVAPPTQRPAAGGAGGAKPPVPTPAIKPPPPTNGGASKPPKDLGF